MKLRTSSSVQEKFLYNTKCNACSLLSVITVAQIKLDIVYVFTPCFCTRNRKIIVFVRTLRKNTRQKSDYSFTPGIHDDFSRAKHIGYRRKKCTIFRPIVGFQTFSRFERPCICKLPVKRKKRAMGSFYSNLRK